MRVRFWQRFYDGLGVRCVSAVADLTFAYVQDSLAESDLVAAFGTSFESLAFASFEIGTVTKALLSTLKSVRYPTGCVDPYVHRLLSSQAVRERLPELAIDEADAIADPDFAVFGVLDPLSLEGSLAIALRDGGPYSGPGSGFSIPSIDAFHMAHVFRTNLIGDRFDNLHVATGHGWNDWFAEAGWDHGWLMTDLLEFRAHLLCVSGID